VKALLIYLVGLAVAFGAMAALISLAQQESGRAFVVVDSSFLMRDAWPEVPAVLEKLEGEGYASYALATEKDLVHSWQDELRLGTVRAFAPCDFSEVASYAEAAQADERILVTTVGSCPTDALVEWRVIALPS
jgi:hypothetical protein